MSCDYEIRFLKGDGSLELVHITHADTDSDVQNLAATLAVQHSYSRYEVWCWMRLVYANGV